MTPTSRTRRLVGLALTTVLLCLGGVLAASAEIHPASASVPSQASCADPWVIQLGFFPDLVGVGAGAEAGCSGCDGHLSGGDRMAARGLELLPLAVEVRAADGETVLWHGELTRRDGRSDLAARVLLCRPPPYQVMLAESSDDPSVAVASDVSPMLCPNTPPIVTLEQRDFDRGMARPGQGRDARYRWAIGGCQPEVVWSIKCWLKSVRSRTDEPPTRTRCDPTATPTP